MKEDTLTALEELEELFEADDEGHTPAGDEHVLYMKIVGYMDDGHAEEA